MREPQGHGELGTFGPERGTGVAVLANAGDANAEAVADALARLAR